MTSADQPRPKYVLHYVSVEDYLPLARQHLPVHSRWIEEFRQRGDLLMVGLLDEPMTGEAMSVFASEAAAREFAEGDPFVLEGVVARWTIRRWNEVVVPVTD